MKGDGRQSARGTHSATSEPSDNLLQRPIELGVAAAAALSIARPLADLNHGHYPALTLVGIGFVIVAQLIVIIDCLKPTSRVSWLVVGISILAAGLIVISQIDQTAVNHGHWRSDAWFGTQLVYLALIRPRGREIAALLITIVASLTILGAWGQLHWAEEAWALLFTAASLGLLILARLTTFALVDEYLDSQSQRATQNEHAEATAASAEALGALRREMHDSLLHTLQRIGAPWSAASPDDIRQSCRDARLRLSEVPRTERETRTWDLVPLITEVVGTPRFKLEGQSTAAVPRQAALALAEATREAVRNTLKHTSDEPTVKVVGGALGTRVTITDHGAGFDVDRASSGAGLGIAGSIVDRMADVGGEASIASSQRGTVVTLRWPAKANPEPVAFGPRPRARLAWVPLPQVIASAIHVVSVDTGLPLLPTLLIWVGLVGLILWTALRVRGPGLSSPLATVLCLIGLVALIANYLWLDPATSSGWALWVPSLTSSLLILSLPGRPPKVAVTIVGVVLIGSITTSILTFGPAATFGSHFGAILAILLSTLVTLVIVFAATTVSRHVHLTHTQALEAEEQVRDAAARDAVWTAWLNRANELTGSFLDDVAEGRVDPTSEATRAIATRLSARVRDELRLWPGDLEVAAELDRLRGLGWDARLQSESRPGGERQELARLLARIASPAEDQSLIATTHDGVATLTITPALTPDQLAPLKEWLALDDPACTQLRSRTTKELLDA